VAATATGITFGAMFLSPRFAGAGLPAILGNAQPIFIVVIAWLFLQERLSLARGLSLAVGCFGFALVISPAVRAGNFNVSIGATLALLTSLGAAIGTVLVRWLRPGRSLFALTAWQLILGGALLLSISFFIGEASIRWSGSFLWVLVFLGVFNSAAFTLGWFWLLQHEEAGRLAIYLFLVPVFGIFWAWVFQGETPGIPLMAGGAFILLGIFLNDSAGFRRWLRSRR
jgi:drug/metabolite transporter (DMT)-like permease